MALERSLPGEDGVFLGGASSCTDVAGAWRGLSTGRSSVSTLRMDELALLPESRYLKSCQSSRFSFKAMSKAAPKGTEGVRRQYSTAKPRICSSTDRRYRTTDSSE